MSQPAIKFNYFSKQYITKTFVRLNGRLSRKGFATALIFLSATVGLSLVLSSFLGLFFMASGFPLLSDLCFFIILFFTAYGLGVLASKRIKDTNINPWWGLGGLVPLVGTIPMFLVLFFMPGTDGDNRFGRDT